MVTDQVFRKITPLDDSYFRQFRFSLRMESNIVTNREAMMEKVTGIGGFFYRAENPEKIAKWYAENLGVDLVPDSYDTPPWKQEAGSTVFAPFSADTKYFGPDMGQQWMINFRVRDLDAMVTQLRDNGNEVEVEDETYPNGRFARVSDPEGNPIQLWEPGGCDPH